MTADDLPRPHARVLFVGVEPPEGLGDRFEPVVGDDIGSARIDDHVVCRGTAVAGAADAHGLRSLTVVDPEGPRELWQRLARHPWPKLVVSTGGDARQEADDDAIAAAIGAERCYPLDAGFVERLEDFLDRAETGVAPY